MGRRRPFPRKGRRTRLSVRAQLLFSVLLGLLLGLFVIHMINARIRPIVITVVSSGVENDVAKMINRVAEESLESGAFDYSELVTLQTDEAGQITALETNMGRLNGLRSLIVQELIQELDQLAVGELSIPVGNLTGSTVLSGHGPRIPVQVLSVGSVSSWFENQFTSAGINQTRHQVVMHIAVSVDLLLPGGIYTHPVESAITVAETVLLGQVPENYTYFSQFDTAREAADAYQDYGADQQ